MLVFIRVKQGACVQDETTCALNSWEYHVPAAGARGMMGAG